MQKLMALLAEADAGDGAGDGATGGGSSKDGQDNKSGDGEFVPKTQFIAALKSAEDKRKAESAALQGQIDALEAQVKAKPAEAPKQYTRAQLNAAVTAGEITQEQADAAMDRQNSEDADNRAERIALNAVAADKRKELIDSDIARYKAVAPEILDDDHDTRKRIKEEFNALVRLGDNPKDVATQWKAIRSVLGPIDRLEKARSGTVQHESHRETGGSGGGNEGGKKGFESTLTPRERAHYSKQITNGLYANWDAVEAELKHANPNTRRKHGANV